LNVEEGWVTALLEKKDAMYRYPQEEARFPAEEGPWDDEINETLFYARKADAYRNLSVEMGKDLKDYLRDHRADETSRAFMEVIAGLRELSNQYNEMSDKKWESFEKKAIRQNETEQPFLDLLGEIYKGMADEYRSCVNIMCKTGESTEHKDDAASRYIYLEDFFKGTAAEAILKAEVKNPDQVQRYVDSFKWRHRNKSYDGWIKEDV
jgi:hypothetical protein